MSRRIMSKTMQSTKIATQSNAVCNDSFITPPSPDAVNESDYPELNQHHHQLMDRGGEGGSKLPKHTFTS